MHRLPHALAALSLTLTMGAGAVAQEEVVPVVSAKSRVTSLSANQVADIFLGKTSRFPDGTQAVPIDQTEESPVRDKFYSLFTGKSAAQVKAHWSKIIFTGRGQPPRQASDSREAKRLVAENPNAIGYVEPSQVDSSLRVLTAR